MELFNNLPKDMIINILLYDNHFVIRNGKLLMINKIKEERKQVIKNVLSLNKIQYEYSEFLNRNIAYVILEFDTNMEETNEHKFYIKMGFDKIYLTNSSYTL